MTGIHHTAIVTADVERSMRFWCDGLGFTELFDHTFTGDWPTLFNARTDRLRSIFLGDPNAPDTGLVELVQFDRGREERDVIGVAAAPSPLDGAGRSLSLCSRCSETSKPPWPDWPDSASTRESVASRCPHTAGKTVAMAVITAPDGVRVEPDRPALVTAVVTGGAFGIGSAVVDRLRTGRRRRGVGHQGRRHPLRYQRSRSVSAAIEQTVAGNGTPDRLVACAGVGASGLLLDQAPADWRRVIDINLTGRG